MSSNNRRERTFLKSKGWSHSFKKGWFKPGMEQGVKIDAALFMEREPPKRVLRVDFYPRQKEDLSGWSEPDEYGIRKPVT